MKTLRYFFLALPLGAVTFQSCDKTDPDNGGGTEQPVTPTITVPADIRQADQFAIDLLSSYYLWTREISNDIKQLTPDTCKFPKAVVNKIRYHQGTKEVDHWTSLTDDLSSYTNSVQGLGLTYGYDLQAGRIANKEGYYFLVVSYVVKDGPAEKAGLKRGDLIMSLDGKDITANNIYDAFNTSKVKLGIAHLTQDGHLGAVEKEVELTAVDMWENPILLSKTFDVNGKKVGYLVYNSFDLNSAALLPDVFRQFKADGIKELILDLRYNGGGYAFTELELASMIAPPSVVAAEEIFQTEVYNSILTNAWKDDPDFQPDTRFTTKFKMDSGDVHIDENVADANPGVEKLYVIVTGGSASASEGLIVGLMPYMPVTLIGKQTYGKYCAGYMLSPKQVYGEVSTFDYSKITKWGMYVMVSKFADKNGNNSAQPDGIPVNIDVADNTMDGFQLGDEDETMLKEALKAAGKVFTKSAPATGYRGLPVEPVEHGMPRGILIKTDVPKLDINL